MIEVKSRGGNILTISPENIDVSKVSNNKITIPKTNELFYPLQLLGYYIAVSKVDVDKQRNLAKSIAIEQL